MGCRGSTTDSCCSGTATSGETAPSWLRDLEFGHRSRKATGPEGSTRPPTWKLPLWVVKRPSNSLSGLGMPGQIFCFRVLIKPKEMNTLACVIEHSPIPLLHPIAGAQTLLDLVVMKAEKCIGAGEQRILLEHLQGPIGGQMKQDFEGCTGVQYMLPHVPSKPGSGLPRGLM